MSMRFLPGWPAALALVAFLVLIVGHGISSETRPTVTVRDLDGQAHEPLAQAGKKATVLFFLMPECPIANAYAPEINRICADFEKRDVACYIVHADPDVTVADAKTHTKDYGFRCPVLLDPAQALVKATGATKSPEAIVLGPDGTVRYRGRIDDRNTDFGKRRAEPTERDLRNALDAVLQGKEVVHPVTDVIGCDLPKARPQKTK
jgi:peroxiredoxin